MDEEIKKLREEVKELREMIVEDRQERGKDRQRISILEWYLKLKKKNKRNDYDILCMDLYKELMDRPKGMETRNVMDVSGLKTREEAGRLMKKTAKEFPLDIILQQEKGKNKGKLRIVMRKAK